MIMPSPARPRHALAEPGHEVYDQDMPKSAAAPLATYTERLPQVRRVFRLFPDRVEVAAKWTFGRNFQMTVRLADLVPQPRAFLVKNRWFGKAVMLGSLAVAVAMVLSLPRYPDLVRRLAMLGWPAAGLAFAVAIYSMPRRQFVHFPRRDGGPGLDLCKAGPDRDRFEAFVAAVGQRIARS
jgi:hypothetical protein